MTHSWLTSRSLCVCWVLCTILLPQIGNICLADEQRAVLPTLDEAKEIFSDMPIDWSRFHHGAVDPTLASMPTYAQRGILVGNPTTENVDSKQSSDTAAFGRGCSEWIRLQLADIPRLGGMPQGSAADTVEDEVHKQYLDLDEATELQAARGSGTSDVAMADLAGSPVHLVLMYRLARISRDQSTMTPEGDLISATGTEQQIIDSLPMMAQKIAARLGAPITSPTASKLSPPDMIAIGHYMWTSGEMFVGRTPDDQVVGKLALAGDPFACYAYCSVHRFTSLSMLQPYVAKLMALMPDSPAVYGLLARMSPESIYPYRDRLAKLAAEYPFNQSFNDASESLASSTEDPKAMMTSALMNIRAAAQSADEWIDLGKVYSYQAQELRRSRTSDNITDAEWKQLTSLYEKALGAAEEAARRDPLNAYTWSEVAGAALFADSPQEADLALRQALSLPWRKPYEAYWTGLQLYQPKWYPDQKKLVALCILAAGDTRLSPGELIRLREGVPEIPTTSDLDNLQVMQYAAVKAAEKLANLIPLNGYVQEQVGFTAIDDNDAKLNALKRAAELEPLNARFLHEIAEVYSKKSDTVNYTAYLQQTISADPGYPGAHYELGLLYLQQGDMAKAKAEEVAEGKYNPRSRDSFRGLAEVAYKTGDYPEAVTSELKALHWYHWDLDGWKLLLDSLNKTGRYVDTLQYAQVAENYVEDPWTCGQAVGDALLALKNPADCLRLDQSVLSHQPKPDEASEIHEQMSKAYLLEGNATKAAAEQKTAKDLQKPS